MIEGMAQIVDHFLPLEGRDCFIVLELPPAEGATDAPEQEQQGARTHRQGKRQRTDEAQPRQERLPANIDVLQMLSQKFRDWAARWAESDASSSVAKEYVMQCRDEAEVGGYRLLLDFMHSVAKTAPTDPGQLLQLLLLAHEHAVEAAVLVCVQRLLEQAPNLPSAICMPLLQALDTGLSGENIIQAAADKLAAACLNRLCELVAADDALQDTAEQQLLLQVLGLLQDTLNNKQKLKLWTKLPFRVLRARPLGRGADGKPALDRFAAERDVLSGFQRLAADEQTTALFSRIRFPEVPAWVLLSCHHCSEALQRFDPDKELLLLATNDPALWVPLRDAMAEPDLPADIATVKQKCERRWLPRPVPLPCHTGAASFEFLCKNDGKDRANSDIVYWNGCHWYIQLKKGTEADAAGVYLYPSVNTFESSPIIEPWLGLHKAQIEYSISLSRGTEEDWQMRAARRGFRPVQGYGWGTSEVEDMSAEGSPTLSWEALWAEGSPYCHDGVVRGCSTLRVPDA